MHNAPYISESGFSGAAHVHVRRGVSRSIFLVLMHDEPAVRVQHSVRCLVGAQRKRGTAQAVAREGGLNRSMISSYPRGRLFQIWAG